MAERFAALDAAALDALLAAARPAFPPTPELATAVMRRLAAPPRPARRPVFRLALVLAVTAALLLGGLAVAGAFGVGPLRILFAESLPSPNVPDTPLGTRLSLGREVTLDELRAASDLPLLVPAELGEPDEAYRLSTGIVSFVYRQTDALGELGNSAIGLLVMEIPGSIDPGLIGKIVFESESTLEEVRIGSGSGYWIGGEPHILRYLEPDGTDGSERSRIVGDALVWEQDGVVFRIESALGRDATIALASSLASLR